MVHRHFYENEDSVNQNRYPPIEKPQEMEEDQNDRPHAEEDPGEAKC